MHSLKRFWSEEAGGIVSAELVTIGTVVTVGAVAGLQTVSTAINEELGHVTKAIRNLDQGYSYRGFRGCNAMSAGSAFVDTSVNVVGGWSATPPGAIQRPLPTRSLIPSPDALENEVAPEHDSRDSGDAGPITAADDKLAAEPDESSE